MIAAGVVGDAVDCREDAVDPSVATCIALSLCSAAILSVSLAASMSVRVPLGGAAVIAIALGLRRALHACAGCASCKMTTNARGLKEASFHPLFISIDVFARLSLPC